MNKYDFKMELRRKIIGKKKQESSKLATWLEELTGVQEDLNGCNIKEILKQVNRLSYLLLTLYPRMQVGNHSKAVTNEKMDGNQINYMRRKCKKISQPFRHLRCQ
jgi:hypothetical protein